ncbi:hypothetical protein [Thermococcus onnurineus]|uniref:hypothetical protein n=1 Tax=Thermococcus onnurineus TaxID=342948 RepID=UPI0011D10C0F|nr:hypothetical protein [Thermococcus onnurineus]
MRYREKKGIAYLGISEAYHYMGNKDKSVEYMILALNELKENGYAEGLFQAILTLGNMFRQEGNFVLSIACYKFLINISQQFNIKSPTMTLASEIFLEMIETAILRKVITIDIKNYIMSNVFSVLDTSLLGFNLLDEYELIIEETLNRISNLPYLEYSERLAEDIMDAYLEVEENPEIVSVISHIWANPSELAKLLMW